MSCAALGVSSILVGTTYTYMWVEPTVKLLCSRRGNRGMYLMSVTPYTIDQTLTATNLPAV